MSAHKANHFLFILPLLASVALGYFSCQKNLGGPPKKQVPKTQEDIQAAQKEVEQAEQRVQALQEKVREAKERVKKAMATGNPVQVAAAEDAAEKAKEKADEAENRRKELAERLQEGLKKRNKEKLVQETKKSAAVLQTRIQQLAKSDQAIRPLNELVQLAVRDIENSSEDAIARIKKAVEDSERKIAADYEESSIVSIERHKASLEKLVRDNRVQEAKKKAAQAILLCLSHPIDYPSAIGTAKKAAGAVRNPPNLDPRGDEDEHEFYEKYMQKLNLFANSRNPEIRAKYRYAQVCFHFCLTDELQERAEPKMREYLAQFWEAVAEDLENNPPST